MTALATVELCLCLGDKVPHRCVESRYINRLGSCKEVENAFNYMIYKPYRGSCPTMYKGAPLQLNPAGSVMQGHGDTPGTLSILVSQREGNDSSNVGVCSVNMSCDAATADSDFIHIIFIPLRYTRESWYDNKVVETCAAFDGNIVSYRTNCNLIITDFCILAKT